MKKFSKLVQERKGDPIDDDWLNNKKPVMTKDGRQVIVIKINYAEVPNVIYGKVLQKEKLYEYQWQDDGTCIKALDMYGNAKKPDENDNLVKGD